MNMPPLAVTLANKLTQYHYRVCVIFKKTATCFGAEVPSTESHKYKRNSNTSTSVLNT